MTLKNRTRKISNPENTDNDYEKKCKEDLSGKMASSIAQKEGVLFRRGLAENVIKREIPEELGGKKPE